MNPKGINYDSQSIGVDTSMVIFEPSEDHDSSPKGSSSTLKVTLLIVKVSAEID